MALCLLMPGSSMEILLIAAILGVLPGAIASRKGHSFVVWWLFGAAIFIVALPWSFLLKSTEGAQLGTRMRKCPDCAEMIPAEALLCRYCGNCGNGGRAAQSHW